MPLLNPTFQLHQLFGPDFQPPDQNAPHIQMPFAYSLRYCIHWLAPVQSPPKQINDARLQSAPSPGQPTTPSEASEATSSTKCSKEVVQQIARRGVTFSR
uniref:Uncharacterized protein n=1 Tax=Ananas comosus var. bracteatus TaxID=296719 RepID=A0A6V7NSJ3_ANACO|nr:unnamed protein product [Ananas comosus var. bracteatus]